MCFMAWAAMIIFSAAWAMILCMETGISTRSCSAICLPASTATIRCMGVRAKIPFTASWVQTACMVVLSLMCWWAVRISICLKKKMIWMRAIICMAARAMICWWAMRAVIICMARRTVAGCMAAGVMIFCFQVAITASLKTACCRMASR